MARFEHENPMDAAMAQAKLAASRGEVPVGAVIVKDRRLIAKAGNRTRELNDPSAHAEILAIRAACAELNDERLEGCDLYVTLEPCTMCAGAISFARIRRLYFAASDEKGGAVISGVRFFDQASCHHSPDVYSAIGESEAALLLREFFQARRD